MGSLSFKVVTFWGCFRGCQVLGSSSFSVVEFWGHRVSELSSFGVVKFWGLNLSLSQTLAVSNSCCLKLKTCDTNFAVNKKNWGHLRYVSLSKSSSLCWGNNFLLNTVYFADPKFPYCSNLAKNDLPFDKFPPTVQSSDFLYKLVLYVSLTYMIFRLEG